MKSSVAADTKYYTFLGKQDFLDDDGYPVVQDSTKSFAKAVTLDNGVIQHFVKFNEDGYLADPTNNLKSFASSSARNSLFGGDAMFKKVSAECFKFYIAFLKTQRSTYLSQAERSAL